MKAGDQMGVYVLTLENCEGCPEIAGVFATEEAANAHLEEMRNEGATRGKIPSIDYWHVVDNAPEGKRGQ